MKNATPRLKIKKSIYTALLIITTIPIFGCASDSVKNAGIRKSDIYTKEIVIKKESSFDHRKNTDSGVFIENDLIKIKSHEKTFLSLLDEVANARRFSYTVYPGELSAIYLSHHKDSEINKESGNCCAYGSMEQEVYSSVEEYIEKSIGKIKIKYANLPAITIEQNQFIEGLAYRKIGDGFEIYDSRKDYTNIDSYKKIFLQNLSVNDASFYIAKLMNIPYETPSSIKTNDLPRRDSSPIQSIGQSTSIQPFNLGQVQPTYPPPIQNGDPAGTAVPPVKWTPIPQQNAIIITGKSAQISKISEIVTMIDSNYRQIIIEGKVFQYSASTSRRIGAALSSLNGQLDIKQGLGNNSLITISQLFGSSVANSLPLNIFNLSSTEKKFALLSSIVAHASDGLVRVTAEPRILLKPGQVSTLDITTTKLVQPATTGAAQSNPIQPVQVEAGVFFTVKPTILSNNKIQLDLFLKHSEFSSTNEKNVLMAVSQNQMTTSIIANNGELISLGGQESKRYNLNSAGIPTLKDISVIGNAFGLSEEEASNSQVEFMIRPIIDDIDIELKAPINSINTTNSRINQQVKERLKYLEINTDNN